MKLLKQNPSELLYHKATSMKEIKHNSWKCIYIAAMHQQERINNSLHSHLITTVDNSLSEDDGYIYLCEDGDMFILFKGSMRSVLTKLEPHISGIIPQSDSGQPSDERITIFDLSVYWNVFFSLCKAKYEKLNHSVKEIKPQRYDYANA